MKNYTFLKTLCLNKTVLAILLIGFFLKSNTTIAQSITINDNNDIVLVEYPDGTSNPAWDAVKDYNVPGALNGKSIYFRIEGADGDDAETDHGDAIGGGEGATVMATFNIGNGPNEIPTGGTFRIIIGEGEEWRAGGGGTGLAFRNPNTGEWTILAVAGGGGAAGDSPAYGQPRPGRAHTDGYWGRRTSTNENNGRNGGNGTNNSDYGRGGKGYISSLNASGEPIGSTGPNDTGNNSTGTFGFGGGGGYTSSFTSTATGGGGGYSGGGGGNLNGDCAGGGGGSYVNTTYAVWHSIVENGSTTSPGHGFAEFQVRCSGAVPNVQITDIVTLNTNDCDPSSDFVWLNVVADPLLGSACGARLVIHNNEESTWDLSIPYSVENTTTAAAANAYIEKDVEYNIILSESSPVVSNDAIITSRTIVFPKFQWQNLVETSLTTTSSVTYNAQNLVTLTGTSTNLIEGFNFQFLNGDGTIAEGEEKTFTVGTYTQKIGLVSFAGTVTCQHEMTINVKAPIIDVNNCESTDTELIESISSTFYRLNGAHTQWQSFSPESSGIMNSLYFEIAPDNQSGYIIPQNATLTIHRGEGDNGQIIYTKNLAGALSVLNTISIDENVYLQEDEVYTFAITDPTTTNWGLAFYITDTYTRGRYYRWSDRDAAFRVNLSEVCDEDTGIVSTYMEDTEIGTTSSKTFTISNTGSDNLIITDITSNNIQYTIATTSLTIAPNNSATFTVNFTPTTVGDQNATITINSNDPSNPSYSFDVKGQALAPLQLTCKDDLVFMLDSNGQLTLNFYDIVDTAEGAFTSSSINGSNSIQFNSCNDIGDYPITLEIGTPGGTPISCSTTIRVNPQVTYPQIEAATLYFDRGAALPTYTYDVSTFVADCPSFSQPILIAGIASGDQFPAGTTTNTFEISNNNISITYSFDVTVVENPVETLINLEQGELTISDWNTITDDDQITLSTSNDGNTLYIGDLNGSVELIGNQLSYEGDTGNVVSVPMNAITNGIVFNGRQGTNGITILPDFTLTGANNSLTIHDISSYQQLGALNIEGNFAVTGDADITITNSTFGGNVILTANGIDSTTGNADIAIANSTFGGTVTLTGNTIDIRANNQNNLTLGNITATGTAATDMNYIYNADDIWFSSPVQTAGNSNLTIRGNFVQQSSNGAITTNELILEGNTPETSVYLLDTATNNINKLTSNTTNHLTSAALFKDIDTVELGIINTGTISFTANTYTFTEDTNLTFSSNSLLNGGINQTATNNSSPAQINHNGGKLTMHGSNSYAFTGAFQYTAVSGTTTDIRNAEVLIDTPNHIQTFGTLEMYFEPFTVAASSTVNFLNKGDFNLNGTSLEGTGIVNGNVELRNKGTLNPGTDTGTGTLTINGDLKLFKTANSSDNEANFAPLINSDTDFDILNVFGTIELANADFEPTGSFTYSGINQEIILINNDENDDIIGTFTGLPEGATFTYGDFVGTISYEGGDGNDISLTYEPSFAYVTTWKTDNPGTSDDHSILIPVNGNSNNYTVDWGDGTIEYGFTGTASHTYATPGIYTVRIFGDFTYIGFNNIGDKEKILTVEQWGNHQWSSMSSAYSGCHNLTITATDAPDLSGITTMAFMFAEAVNFNGDLSHWDVSNIQEMNSMFRGATNFTGDISGWNTSNVANMGNMFQDATAFNGDISSWDTGNVINMSRMFLRASTFNSNISGWNTSNVKQMIYMFQNALSFDQDLGGWDISNLGNNALSLTATNMFEGAMLSTTNYDNTLIGWATLEAGESQIPSNIAFNGGLSQYCQAATKRQELIATYGWIISDGNYDPNCTAKVAPKVCLQGAALNPNIGEENLMRDDLRIAGIIPTTSPYADMISCETTVFNTTGDDAIVDWVWVELHDATDNTLVVDAQSALLQRDGDIVSVDGITHLAFNTGAGNYYIIIKHRNHLAIMSANAIALSTNTTTVDFTDGSIPTYGSNAQTTFGMPTGILGMWGGNANNDTIIQYSGTTPDSPEILSEVLNEVGNFLNFPTYIIHGYKNYDLNMDGNTQYSGSNPDTPIILQNVLAHPGNFLNFSTYQIKEQLPSN
ncbi:BspA family leucine-rich repeat surface protein [Kordia sp.]|uniref:BspA family leucine-rich repeat surface protein n=1 Tax=Kordia sp. TaxID=1965332 RepID=UPI003D6BE0E1